MPWLEVSDALQRLRALFPVAYPRKMRLPVQPPFLSWEGRSNSRVPELVITASSAHSFAVHVSFLLPPHCPSSQILRGKL